MRLGLVVRELHSAETALWHDLLDMSDRHHAEPEIHYVSKDLAGWSQDHVTRLTRVGVRFGLDLQAGPLTSIRRAVNEPLEPGLRLLADLRGLHRDIVGVSLDWELLAQTAQALQETELVELSAHCHPQTLRQLKWSNAMLKMLSPQILTS